MFDPRPLYCSSLTTAVGGTKETNIVDSAHPTVARIKDLGSFTIPYAIGDAVFEKALCDLGASINLMPMSIIKKLNLGEARPTTVTLQLVDRSLTHLCDIIKDVLVKVDKFIFPVDFIILDMEEDKEVPIILKRPFLATRRALIDV